MDRNFDRIIKLTMEIEGLARVFQQRGDNAPAELEELLSSHIAELNELTGYCAPAPQAEKAEAESAELEQQEDADPFDVDDEDEPCRDESRAADSERAAVSAEPAVALPDSVPTAKIMVPDDSDEDYVVEEIAEVSSEPEVMDQPEMPEMPEIPTVDFQEERKAEPAATTLNDRLAINASRDIRSAFSRNDYYLFKRELFGGKETEWADAMNIIMAMSSFEEAEEYFYNDLAWDPDRDEVKEFLGRVKNHFA